MLIWHSCTQKLHWGSADMADYHSAAISKGNFLLTLFKTTRRKKNFWKRKESFYKPKRNNNALISPINWHWVTGFQKTATKLLLQFDTSEVVTTLRVIVMKSSIQKLGKWRVNIIFWGEPSLHTSGILEQAFPFGNPPWQLTIIPVNPRNYRGFGLIWFRQNVVSSSCTNTSVHEKNISKRTIQS